MKTKTFTAIIHKESVPAMQKINKDNVSFLSRIHPTLCLVRRGASSAPANIEEK
ncbi:hypothetical protein [aff. Roholtiella sp. LEGE 12411]|uniref:hypothetical protein n=1 Tax=aff. Roholtiella sp. LEGE 12411 TaxID=1828822 RepID=UPI001880AEBC|nr:hypothetical protein [aff. Roholtiella sp. LEGE 12411]